MELLHKQVNIYKWAKHICIGLSFSIFLGLIWIGAKMPMETTEFPVSIILGLLGFSISFYLSLYFSGKVVDTETDLGDNKIALAIYKYRYKK